VKRGERKLRFFRRYDDGIVHLRVEVDVTLCGVGTSGFGDYVTGPADAPRAPEPTCAVCVERLASGDLTVQLLDAARRAGTRRLLPPARPVERRPAERS
jgi:hypothetical protein